MGDVKPCVSSPRFVNSNRCLSLSAECVQSNYDFGTLPEKVAAPVIEKKVLKVSHDLSKTK